MGMRKSSVMIWILLLIGVVLGIAIIDASSSRPIDWTKNYGFKEKKPFGLYVFRQELPNILGKNRKYEDFGETIYEMTVGLDTLKEYDKSIVVIDNYFGVYNEDVDYFLKFIEGGGEAFISAESFSDVLVDTLGVGISELPYNYAATEEKVSYSLVGDSKQVKFDRVGYFDVFKNLRASNSQILGYLHLDGKKFPNFVKINVGKGVIYLHTMPSVFGNYHMLQPKGYTYSANVLNVLKHPKILLMDKNFEGAESYTPLRVLLQNPGYREAWYLLLVGLLLMLVFKSKREQRAVKVILPEPNLSKEFAETIGNLYYENGSPGNIVHKKIDYFLFLVRSTYHLETMDLKNEKFLRQLSLKSGVDEGEVRRLFQVIERYKGLRSFGIEDVKVINRVIEDFKQKANLV